MKIIHLLSSYRWTGPADGVVSLCEGLTKKGHHVQLFCSQNPGNLVAQKAEAKGVETVTSLHLSTQKPLLSLLDIPRLRRILIRTLPDILHLHLSVDHWVGSMGTVFLPTQAKIIRTIHHPRALNARPFRQWLYGLKTDAFVTLSESDRKRLHDQFKVDRNRTMVIKGAVDTLNFHPDHDPRPIRAEFGIKSTAPVVGMVARFQDYRRHDLLIKSIAALKEKLPMIRLLLVGRGEHREALEALVRSLGLVHHVLFAGYRDQDLPQVYAAMNVMVLLASGSDGSCRAILEAMSCGVPVVAFPVGALPETIVEDVTGHLVPDGDLDQLTRTLSALLGDRNRMIRMSESARKHMEKYFQEKHRVEKTERFYESLIQ